ncbi:MAG: hypothetical protein ACFB21_08515, partial [Opitutales bacterium]
MAFPQQRPDPRNAFRRLLDDPSPVVRASLLEAFRERGELAIGWLREWADHGNGVAPAARE